jgi:Asp-tRNA(Asn)/Glu-tRNA(Gln) amidotransferase B subunit
MADKEFQLTQLANKIAKIDAKIISKQQTNEMLEADLKNPPTNIDREKRLEEAIQDYNDLVAQCDALLASKQHAIVSGHQGGARVLDSSGADGKMLIRCLIMFYHVCCCVF